MISRRGRRGGPLWWAASFVCAVTVVFAAGQLVRANNSAAAPVAAVWAPATGAGPDLPPHRPRPTTDRMWATRPALPRTAAHQVPIPRRFRVPELGLDLPVVPTGVTRGEMELPEHPTTIGWYAYGPRPGDRSGAAVLAGHVDSRRYGIGPLAELRTLRKGDRIVVLSAAGSKTFRVVAVQLIAKHTRALDEVFDRTGPGRLEIVTCGGAYLPDRGGYQDNVVVSAVPG